MIISVVNELKARVRRFSQGDGAALPPPLVKPAFQVVSLLLFFASCISNVFPDGEIRREGRV